MDDWYVDASDVTVLNVLVEDLFNAPAQVEHAAQWRDELGLHFEVLADSEEAWVQTWGDEGNATFVQHSYTVINADGTVAWHQAGQTSETLDQLIAAVEAAD